MKDTKNPVLTIELTGGKEIQVELFPDKAENTVKNFISLVKKGFYDGLIFHRVIEGFMIQGGCPTGSGTGGPGYGIVGEFSQNGHQNDLQHHKGIISMARSASPDSAGSQFFLMHEDSAHLDGQYAAFGKTIAGQGYIDAIATTEKDGMDKPINEQKIIKMTVETFGRTFEEPEKIG